ncbi:unnamed protein product [Dibothriocephalus latus]|uniref:Uncharacterized protein n=1 Tax=Dibothriocephalus latus TaxID=60516 RepID=A0A3P7L869_DIBLA|nr:unnamed protein product [Dibothriocephalus latus]
MTEPTHGDDSISPLMSRSSSHSSVCSVSSASSCSVWSSSSSLSPPYCSPEIPTKPFTLIPSPRAAEDLRTPQSSLKPRIRWQQRLRRFLRNLCCFSVSRTEVE